jgi:putative oxygen-independent coproporphyrinogen III oxidase
VASIYVHFPWCLAKCPYCDFVSYATERRDIDHAGYADAVIREAEARALHLAAGSSGIRRISSIFFGGGTPSLWDPRELGRVLARLRTLFAIADNDNDNDNDNDIEIEIEITVECNPTSLDADRARALVEAGANRLSIGTQSLRADQLRFLGRLHDPAGATAAVSAAISAGVPRVSTDLIFGLPDQTPADACEQAEALASSGLRHLSCYQLTIEPGTQFGERKKRGLLPMAKDEAVAESFLAIDRALTDRGLRHYEISNYAMPGEEARHNIAYWRGDEYIGLGCAAFGFVREGVRGGGKRYRNAIVPKDYVERTRSIRSDMIGEGDGVTITSEQLDGSALLRERIMLGLRMLEGVDMGRASSDLDVDPWTPERLRTIETLVAKQRLVREGDVLRIPRDAWLFTDDTASRLF